MLNAFGVVEAFEQKVAAYCGAPYCVATSTGTAAIFLALMRERERFPKRPAVVECPARTFISVPMAIKQAGFRLKLIDTIWFGEYTLRPTAVVDSALRFRPGMYSSGLVCLSFHARKILNIGEGGAILTNSLDEANWLKAARYSGRSAPSYRIEDVTMMGWQCYMTPEKAARGLHLMEYIRDVREQLPDQAMQYPDLRQVPFFKEDV